MLKQPFNSIKLTNVAFIRYKINNQCFEIACYRNKALNWRDGLQSDISEVLQSDEIFENASHGAVAKRADLQKIFPDKTKEEIIQIILRRGEMQVSDKERNAQQSDVLSQIVAVILEKCVHPVTLRHFNPEAIRMAIKEIGYPVKLERSPKVQALQIIKQLQEKGYRIKRADMRVRISCAAQFEDKVRGLLSQLGIGKDKTQQSLTALTNTVETSKDKPQNTELPLNSEAGKVESSQNSDQDQQQSVPMPKLNVGSFDSDSDDENQRRGRRGKRGRKRGKGTTKKDTLRKQEGSNKQKSKKVEEEESDEQSQDIKPNEPKEKEAIDAQFKNTHEALNKVSQDTEGRETCTKEPSSNQESEIEVKKDMVKNQKGQSNTVLLPSTGPINTISIPLSISPALYRPLTQQLKQFPNASLEVIQTVVAVRQTRELGDQQYGRLEKLGGKEDNKPKKNAQKGKEGPPKEENQKNEKEPRVEEVKRTEVSTNSQNKPAIGNIPTNQPNLPSCSTCPASATAFTTPQNLRQHMKTEWHVDNLKRKAQGKPVLTEEEWRVDQFNREWEGRK